MLSILSRLLWFVLAGFILGFATSTIWEWYYYRGKRLIGGNQRIFALENELRHKDETIAELTRNAESLSNSFAEQNFTEQDFSEQDFSEQNFAGQRLEDANVGEIGPAAMPTFAEALGQADRTARGTNAPSRDSAGIDRPRMNPEVRQPTRQSTRQSTRQPTRQPTPPSSLSDVERPSSLANAVAGLTEMDTATVPLAVEERAVTRQAVGQPTIEEPAISIRQDAITQRRFVDSPDLRSGAPERRSVLPTKPLPVDPLTPVSVNPREQDPPESAEALISFRRGPARPRASDATETRPTIQPSTDASTTRLATSVANYRDAAPEVENRLSDPPQEQSTIEKGSLAQSSLAQNPLAQNPLDQSSLGQASLKQTIVDSLPLPQAELQVADELTESPDEAVLNYPDLNYPDDLTRVDGVGKATCKRLYESGICTWHQLAGAKSDQLGKIAKIRNSDKIDGLKRHARRLAKENNRKDALYEGPTPDDFTEIKGVKSTDLEVLYSAGIVTFGDLAKYKPEDLKGLFRNIAGVESKEYLKWIQRAQELDLDE